MDWSIDGMLETVGLGRHKSLGLAMSGGGAKGFAHIGVFSALEKFGMTPTVMSGVSAGSIATVLYGAGLAPDDIAQCFAAVSKFNNFTALTIPREGIFRLDKFAALLDSWLPVKRLEELKIPTVVCATDMDHGKSIGWAKGEIVPRVVASCSIPLLFHPVKINDVNYVDGGVLRNLPAWAVRGHCKTLIGSNCSPLSRNWKYKGSILDITWRTYQLMSKANTLQDINMCDYIIQPHVMSTFGTFELSEMRKIINVGYDAACRVLEKMQ